MSGPRLSIRLRASPVLAALILSAHAAAAGAIFQVLPALQAAACAALLAILALLVVRQSALLRSSNSPCSLEFSRDAGLRIGLRGGAEIVGKVSPRRYVSRWLVVLRLSPSASGRRTILVARDMLPAGEFRHVRMWALWGEVPAGPAGEGA